MTAYSNITNRKLKALGIYQIAGGLIGEIVVMRLVSNLSELVPAYYPLIFFVFLLYLYSILCGILVLINHSKALKHSLINQYLQLTGFSISGYAFHYFSGSSLTIAVDITEGFFLKFNFLLFSDFNLKIATDSSVIAVYLNIIPLFIIIFINNLIKKILAQTEENLIASIGEVV